MYPFSFDTAADEAAALAAGRSGARYIAGGTTLVDLMRETVERPTALVDINRLPYRDVTVDGNVLRIGSLVRMSDLGRDDRVRREFPAMVQALELSASAQLRNMASVGGNLLQRPRCLYFRDVTAACNRRTPGSGCAAINGVNRTHAILGTSSDCVATHPSDLAVALVALDAVVLTTDASGRRRIPVAELFRRPGDTPQVENTLRPGELITGVELPMSAVARRSGYLKVRDRQSYEFALASAAVGLDIDRSAGGVVRAARVAVGGVGTVPWRLPEVERAVVGRRPGPQLWQDAAAHAADGARALADNGFKIELVQRVVRRQLTAMAGPA